MGRPRTYLITLALSVCATTLAACGEEDAQLLPGKTAGEITANLDTVKQLAGAGDCAGAEGAAQEVSEQVEAVEGIDPKLKQALRDGAAKLNEVVSECEESTTEPTSPTEIPPQTEEAPEKPEKKAKEKKPKEEKEKPKEEEAPEPAPPGPPEETPPAVPPGQEEAEPPSGGVSPGNPVGEGG